MLIAMIADLHGNRPATEALEKDLAITRPDDVWCLGDIVGKGPSNVFTYDWAVKHASKIIGGNWDYGVGGKHFPNDHWYWESLGEERLQYLNQLPREETVWLSGRKIRLFHGRPVMDVLVGVRNEEDVLDPYFRCEDGSRWDAVIYADAHRQAMRTMNPGYLINTGSVGNALGEVHGCYLLVECVPGMEKAPIEFRFRQFEYDREAAALDAEAELNLHNRDFFAG